MHGHAKLIQAFARVHAQAPQTSLWILGEGSLRLELEQLIGECQLENAVQILDEAPLPYVQAADCFVLSSDHEGQPQILLETMILGKPVLATDIDGVNNMLNGHRYGRLVENSVEGLALGMMDFVENGMAVPVFDAEQYQREAVAKFHSVVLGLP